MCLFIKKALFSIQQPQTEIVRSMRSKRLTSSDQGFLDELIKTYPLEEKRHEFCAAISGKPTVDKAKAFVKVAVLDAYRKELKVCVRVRTLRICNTRYSLNKNTTTLQARQRFHPTFNPYGLVMPESRLDQTTTILATKLMERVQRGGRESVKVDTETEQKQKEQKQKHPQKKSQKNTRSKYKMLKRKHKALQRKYSDLEKETMRRQMAFDLRMEILIKERGVREALFTHAISELESKLSAFTNAQ